MSALRTTYHVRDPGPECQLTSGFDELFPSEALRMIKKRAHTLGPTRSWNAGHCYREFGGGGTTVIVRDCRIAGREHVLDNSGTATSTTPRARTVGSTGAMQRRQVGFHHCRAIEAGTIP